MDILKALNQKKKGLDKLNQNRKPERENKEVICPDCGAKLFQDVLHEKLGICPDCGHYFSMSPKERIRLIGDEKSIRIKNKNMKTGNPLNFPEYEEKLTAAREKTKQQDAVVTGTLTINGIKAAVGVLDARFFMGSMGTVVGEQITAITEYARKKKLPLILVCQSGGARMQEGIFSLMQMAKTSAAIERFRKEGGLYISVLCHPTTGGVSASFAFLGDIILAEPRALIGFAGPRVIEQTIGQTLPEGFQRAESQLENGMIDQIVERRQLKERLTQLLRLHGYREERGRTR